MIIWGHTERESSVGTGELDCPLCGVGRPCSFMLLTKYFHIYFVRLFKTGPLVEFVRCSSCGLDFSLDELEHSNKSSSPALQPKSIHDLRAAAHIQEVVDISETTLIEIRKRLAVGEYEPTVAVRVVPKSAGSECDIQFDFPYSDGRDWVGRSRNLTILIAKEDASMIQGCVIDFQNDEFRIIAPTAK